jgi:hypothetical protein
MVPLDWYLVAVVAQKIQELGAQDSSRKECHQIMNMLDDCELLSWKISLSIMRLSSYMHYSRLDLLVVKIKFIRTGSCS